MASLQEPLFKRAITMSGEATLRKPRTISWHNAMYMDQLKKLSLDQLSPANRVQAFRTMPADEICNKLPLTQHFCGLIDGRFLKADIALSQLADGRSAVGKPDWCEELLVGDCLHDVRLPSPQSLPFPFSFQKANSTLGHRPRRPHPRRPSLSSPSLFPLRATPLPRRPPHAPLHLQPPPQRHPRGTALRPLVLVVGPALLPPRPGRRVRLVRPQQARVALPLSRAQSSRRRDEGARMP
jgi:hypothetical protein